MKIIIAPYILVLFSQLVRADEQWGSLLWEDFQGITANEIRITQDRWPDPQDPQKLSSLVSGGSLVFRANDQSDPTYPNLDSPGDKRVARLTVDGNSKNPSDAAALMFYSQIKRAGMQLGVGPGGHPWLARSPHAAALRVQRVNGANEEGMVWTSAPGTEPVPGSPAKPDAPFKLSVIKTNAGLIQPFEIVSGAHIVTRYNPDGSKSEFWKGFPISFHEPQNGALIYETFVKYPVINSGVELYTNQVLKSAPAGTEANFKDFDGLIKKAIKQYNGNWTRLSNNLKI
jgi:hypothetical protein